MTFVTAGLAIAGLVAVVVPIVIHLLSRRRRRAVEWAAMRFLMEAFRKHRRRLLLEQMVLLAVRCLILALLGLALARPILEGAGVLRAGGSRAVILVVDNGLASGLALDDDRTALERLIEEAQAIVRTLQPGDAVGLVAAARPARVVLAPPSTQHDAVIELLGSLRPADADSDLTGALAALRLAVEAGSEEYDQVIVYLLSEFRRGSAPLDAPLPALLEGLGGRVMLRATAPVETAAPNVQIVEVDPVRSLVLPGGSDGSGQLSVRLARHGGQLGAEVTRVRLVGEDIAPVEPRVVQWEPGQTEAHAEFLVQFPVHGDRAVGLTALIDADALPADDVRHAVLELRNRIRVILVDRRAFGFEPSLDRLTAGGWIRRALEPAEISPIEVVEVEPAALDVADLRTADVAFVTRPDLLADAGWGLLRRFVDAGGLLVIAPPGEINVHQWVDHLATDLDLPWVVGLEVTEIAGGKLLAGEQPESDLLRLIASELSELARPVAALRVLPIDPGQTEAEPLLLFDDGAPMLVIGSPRAARGDGGEPDPALAEGAPSVTALGQVALLAVAPELEWTNLPSQPLMVPLLHELVRQGASLHRSARRLHAGDRPRLGFTAAISEVAAPDGRTIPLDPGGRAQEPLASAGLYQVLDPAGQMVDTVAVNVLPAAGATEQQSRQAVTDWLQRSGPWETVDPEDLRTTLRSAGTGSPIAGLLLLAVLALAIIETALARWVSHAQSRGGRADVGWLASAEVPPAGVGGAA